MGEPQPRKFADIGSAGSLRTLVAIAYVCIVPILGYQMYVLSRDVLTGDGSGTRLLIAPRYDLKRLPVAGDRLAADFAQVYFPAQQANLADAYDKKTTATPPGFVSRYAPAVHFLCAITICKMPYGIASLAHLVIQFILFLFGLWFALRELDLTKMYPLAMLFVTASLFLTPAGLSWFERGQFSLYVALCYLWLHLGIVKDRKAYVVISALFAYIKWTSLPYLFVALSVYLLTSTDFRQFFHRTRLILAYPVTFVVLFVAFFDAGLRFVSGLISQEAHFLPAGVSLAMFFPNTLVKLLPAMLAVAGTAAFRLARTAFDDQVPFLLGCAVLLLVYPAKAYEYSVPCVFGLIPMLGHWVLRSPGLPTIQRATVATYIAFVMIASLSNIIIPTSGGMVTVYIVTTMTLFGCQYAYVRWS